MAKKYRYGNQKLYFEIEGLDELLEDIEKMGRDIDDAVAEALVSSAQPIYKDINKWANKHKLTGVTKGEVIKPIIKKEGNYIYVELGISGHKGSWHSVFVEYGRPGYTSDPGIRKAFKINRKKVKDIQLDVIKRWGMISG